MNRGVRSHFGLSDFAVWPYCAMMMCDVWAMQSAWAAASMQAWDVSAMHCAANAAVGQALQAYNVELWQCWHDHIAAELLRVASAGLTAVNHAIWLEEHMRAKLMNIRSTFTYIQHLYLNHSQGIRSDDLELSAANALNEIDGMLQQEQILAERGNPKAQAPTPLSQAVVQELKLLQLIVQDVVVLACSRYIDMSLLMTPGIPSQMLSRLVAVFTEASLFEDNALLWSRIGNSKHQVFRQGLHGRAWRMRQRRIRRKEGDDEIEASTEALDPVASSSVATSSVLVAGGPTLTASVSADPEQQLLACLLGAGSVVPAAPPGLFLPSPTQAAIVGECKSIVECDIDIAREIECAASAGLEVVKSFTVIPPTESSKVVFSKLAFIKETFMVLRVTPAYYHTDPRGEGHPARPP